MFNRNEVAVFLSTFAPTAERDFSFQMRILLSESGEILEATLLNVEFVVQDEYLPGDIAHTDEGIDDVRAQFPWDVADAVTSNARTIYRPVAEVANNSGVCF